MNEFIISYWFIKEHLTKNHLYKEFALWIKLKSLFKKHTIIYNWSYRRLHELTNISIPTLKKYLPTLIELGWVEINGQNLTISPFKKVCGGRKSGITISFDKKETFNEIVDSVRALTIKHIYVSQKFISDLKLGRIKASAKKLSKWHRIYRKHLKTEITRTVMTSTRRIGKELGLSQTSATSLLRKLNERRIVSSKPLFEILREDHPFTHLKNEVCGWIFWENNSLYLNKGTQIVSIS